MNKNNKILVFFFVIAIALFTFAPSLSAYEGTIILCYHAYEKRNNNDIALQMRNNGGK